MIRRLLVLGVLAALGAATLVTGTSVTRLEAQAPKKPAQVAQVRYIYKGLSVRPPGRKAIRGKNGQRLFRAYALQTGRGQKASIGFPDGSLLHLNQQTQVVLRSPSLTWVDRGQVAQEVQPGTKHWLQTGSAVAAAIGTSFVLSANQSLTSVTVVEGAVQLTSKYGTVLVKTNEQVAVSPSIRLGAPRSVNGSAAVSWATSMPGPTKPIGQNIALDANGGKVLAVSSFRRPRGSTSWSGPTVNDGSLRSGWQSAAGAVRNQWIRVAFGAHRSYRITEVVLACGATGGQTSANDLQHFQIGVSTTSSSASAFKTALRGTCRQSSGLQIFRLPRAQTARYVQLRALDNHGGKAGIAVAEMEVVTSDRVKLPVPASDGSVNPSPPSGPPSAPQP